MYIPMLGVLKSLLSGVSTLSASCSVTNSSVLPAMVLGCVCGGWQCGWEYDVWGDGCVGGSVEWM